ncbi:MAG: MBL fold metallo-hydrolase [Streptosporangiaceae bacterium]
MRINLCGTRGSTPAPGRDFVRYGGHTSCVAITPDGAAAPELLLDAGTGIRQVTALLADRAFLGTIALTHLHWDHMQGLPFFAAGDRDDARVRLLLPASGAGSDPVASLERTMSPPTFPITPRQLRGDWTFGGLAPGSTGLGPLTLLARQIPHKGGRTFGYRVSDGHAAIAYLPDHDPAELGPGPDGLGVYHDTALELADGVDVLMHDSFWYADEFDPARTFGHAAAEYAIGLAAAAGASRVLLLHHRPDRTDTDLDKLAARLPGSQVPATLAADGEVLRL